MMILANKGVKDKTLEGGHALQHVLLHQLAELRSTYATITDKLSCRMPLAYTHFVQVLVDTFVVLTPMALYSQLGAYSVFGVGVLTLFYAGLLDLAKIFLDPLNNEDYCEGGVDMDLGVFIREANAGTRKWMQGLEVLPDTTLVAVGASSSGKKGK